MVPEHLRPTFPAPNGLATMPQLEAAAWTIQASESVHGVNLHLVVRDDTDRQFMVRLAENLARRLAEQILFLVDGTVIVGRDVSHG